MTLFIYAAVGYVLVLVVIWAFQDRLLYLPDRHTPSPRELSAAGLRWWPERPSAEGYRGLLAEPASGVPRGTIVVFHGNAGAAIDRERYLEPLKRAGFRVLLAEYPGYGWRGGQPSEATLVADGVETLARVRDEFGDPVHIWGESLGAGVAAAVAGRAGHLSASVVLITPWETLEAVAQRHYWYLPTGFLVRDRYDSVANLSRYRGPVALVISDRDRTIPPEHGVRLHDALAAQERSVRLWRFAEAGHNDWPDAPDASWWRDVLDYTAPPARPQPAVAR